MEINLKEKSLLELKGLFYDFLAQREQAQRNIDAINQEISLRLQKEQVNGQEKNQ